jgi:hypothetical protein
MQTSPEANVWNTTPDSVGLLVEGHSRACGGNVGVGWSTTPTNKVGTVLFHTRPQRKEQYHWMAVAVPQVTETNKCPPNDEGGPQPSDSKDVLQVKDAIR